MGREREDRLKQMARALAAVAGEALKPEDWELLQQQIVEGRSYAELTAATGRSEVALRKRRFDALRKLRRAVVERYGDRFADDVQETLPRT
jgi:DNA-directed RNA polymerase specialized sigma24 family protein